MTSAERVYAASSEPSIAPDNPRTLREARESPDWPDWETAVQAELDQLQKMGTWELVHIMHLHCPIQHGQTKLTIGCATWPAEIGPSHGASPCYTRGLMERCFTVPYWWLMERLSPSNIGGLTH